MSAGTLLTGADLRFCHLVAVRRSGGELRDPNPTTLDEAVAWPAAELDGTPRFGTPFRRAAALAEATLRVFEDQAKVTALFAVVAQLRLERHQLIAPQGVLAGMIDGLQSGRISTEEMWRWLEDRAIPLL